MPPPDSFIAIIGAGGHGAVVADAALAARPGARICFFDDAPQADRLLGLPVIAGEPAAQTGFPAADWRVIVAIGDNHIRQTRMAALAAHGYRGATIIHPAATVSDHAEIGAGTAVLAGAIVNARARVSEGCIVNTGAIVEHDVHLGGFTHMSPGAVAAGGASIGARCWIGANAVVRQGVRIGDNVILGALCFASDDLPVPGTYVGTPARPIAR